MPILTNFLVLVLCFITLQDTLAGVYICEENGNTTYSDTPCSDSAATAAQQKINVIQRSKNTTPTAEGTRVKKIADRMESVRMKREINREIDRLKQQIAEQQELRAKKLQQLASKKEQLGYADNYEDELLFKDLEKLITDEEATVNNQYYQQKEDLSRKITILQKKLEKYQSE